MTARIFLLLGCIVLFKASFAQPNNEYIIQLKPNTSLEKYHLKDESIISKKISKRLNISCLKLKSVQKSKIFIDQIKNDTTVLFIQKNKKIDLRNIPNDPFFDQQWQYQNNGDNNGKINADIAAPEAWTITTGGTTALGEELVIAVLDGGLNPNHPDFADNIWTNAAEIPDNGIDDDQNGYIDDYFGWNFNKNNNDISDGGEGINHGTAVAGILGARGDNSLGVAGINWNIKLMNLVADDSDATVIEAYNYALEMRRQYEATNGEKGALVVVTSASLGRSGFAEDAPIWCDMYETLGENGILNIVATANNPINVDTQGDIPSSCTSDYMISVTNTNNADQLDPSAAYGAMSIDLGAPGTSVFTTRIPETYGAFGATSAATPQVGGAAALLYAIPIMNFAEDAKKYPSETALLVKKAILGGVDKVVDLEGITVSGGRLNIYKSLQFLQEKYGISTLIPNDDFIQINHIAPNPISDNALLEVTLYQAAELQLELFDTAGNLLYTEALGDKDIGLHRISLSIDNQPIGVYFLRVIDIQKQEFDTVKIFVR